MRRADDFDIETIGIMPPVVERRRRQHRNATPNGDPCPERAIKTPESHRARLLRRRAKECRPQDKPAGREAAEQTTELNRQVRRSPERVAPNRAMPRNIPEDSDYNRGGAEHHRAADP